MRATNRLASQPLVPWCSVTVLLSMGTVDVKQLLLHQVQRAEYYSLAAGLQEALGCAIHSAGTW